jgi:hypothetical protein
MIGFAGLPRDPSLVWHAAQTLVAVAWPLAKSGFADTAAAGLASSAANETLATTSSRQDSKGAASFMGCGVLLCKTR